jgi:protein gp37
VIVGAEKAEDPRTMNEDWVRDLRDYTVLAGKPFFYKQKIDDHGNPIEMPELDGRVWDQFPQEEAE